MIEILIIAMLIAAMFVWPRAWYNKERAEMTQAERDEEDREMQSW